MSDEPTPVSSDVDHEDANRMLRWLVIGAILFLVFWIAVVLYAFM